VAASQNSPLNMLRASNLAATYYSGQSFEIAASQIQKLYEAPFVLKETVKQETTHG
jgi:hypothetical protein